MIALIIVGALLLIIAAVLFLPLDVSLSFSENLHLSVRFFGLTVYKLKDKSGRNSKKKTSDSSKTETPKKENEALGLFKRLKEKYGFSGAVKQIFGFVKELLPHIKELLKHIKFKRTVLDITVAEDDAAKTAIEYGRVCAVAYPVLSGLESLADIKYKSINIRSNFESSESRFLFSGLIRTRVFFLLAAVFKVYSQYKKFIARIENDGRK